MTLEELIKPDNVLELLAIDEDTDEETQLSPVKVVSVDGDTVVFAIESASEALAETAGSIIRNTCYARNAAFHVNRRLNLRTTTSPTTATFMQRTAAAVFRVIAPEPMERAGEAFRPVKSGGVFEVRFATNMRVHSAGGG
jgi:hypothetical protein